MTDRGEITVEVGLDEVADEARVRARVAARAGVAPEDLPKLTLLRRSLDARRGSVRFHLAFALGERQPQDLGAPPPREVGPARVVVVGDGPAGLFAAYALARRGIGAVVVDRGKPVQPRRRDLKGLTRHGVVDPDSNYCFGEGGAGTYSDGKLYTRSQKRGDVGDVLGILARHGAPEVILTDARPHIGSNRLPVVVSALRTALESVGVVFRFGARVEGLLREDGHRPAVRGVRLGGGEELPAEAVILATGHSASDVLEGLLEAGVRLTPKGFAFGVRIEHPQPLVNRIQYGRVAGHPALPAAAYSVAEQVDGRGVFSFCMCPGGFIVPAATVPGGVVVNGMSLSRRDSPFANSGLVVAVEPEDLARAGFDGPLGGVRLQRLVESAAFDAGGGMLRAPAQRATDFVAGRATSLLPRTSYVPGATTADLAAVLDTGGLDIAARLRRALPAIDRRLRGYLTEDALLLGVETRTSSPVRVPRDPVTFESPDLAGLYPTGEGAGYAGGIVSAALDGLAVAARVADRLGAEPWITPPPTPGSPG